MSNLSVAELAYLAGIIDGEGSIMLIHYPPGTGNGNKNDRWMLKLVISNTDTRLMNWLGKRFDGFVCRQNPKATNNFKLSYTWRAEGIKAVAVLELALPYMLLKRKQAELGIKFQSTVTGMNYTGRGVPARVVEQRRRMAAQMALLNKKGRE